MEFLILKGCRQNNLKNISLSLPKHSITVMTGVSGSGKSSLAFDTLFAEGQRRFLEYLSPQARQLIRQLPKPDVDSIEGLSPTLAVQQSRSVLPPLSTVATHTDLYDFFCLLFARVGVQHSPSTGKPLFRYTRQQIVELLLLEYLSGTRLQLVAPLSLELETLTDAIQRLQKMGFMRLRLNEVEFEAGEAIPDQGDAMRLDVVVDRIVMKEDIRERLAASVETALDLSKGILKLLEGRESSIRYLTEVFLCPESGVAFAPLEPSDFNFHSPRGACPVCQGRGGRNAVEAGAFHFEMDVSLSDQVVEILDHLPATKSRIYQAVWQACGVPEEKAPTLHLAEMALLGSDNPLSVVLQVPEGLRSIETHWKGLAAIIEEDLDERRARSPFQTADYVSWQLCPACHGARLKPEALACRIHAQNIADVCTLTVDQALETIQEWIWPATIQPIADEILPEVTSRLKFLAEVGLGYLELNRPGKTLSEGEAQRVILASQIGARLSGIIYVLDEPSRGLHRRDVRHLSTVIAKLKAIGNTVIIVEHDPIVIRQADHIVEIGPGSGTHGGQIVFEGSPEALNTSDSPTGQWLSGKVTLPKHKRRKAESSLRIINTSEHNLKHLTLDIPLGVLTGLCGVSGSGKSTLAIDVMATELQQYLLHETPTAHIANPEEIERLQVVGQKASGVTVRATPATFVGLMTSLRQLFAKTKLARARGYTAARFTTNKKGGRCEACEGLGIKRVDMEFMPDLYVTCDICQGMRYNYETLQVHWEGLSIADVLNLSVEECLKQFRNIPELAHPLTLMQELGLDYLTLGQNFTTLSGGEIQRLKLIAELARPNHRKTLYIMDEPCVGLHFSDVAKLAKILHRLVEEGHSVVVVEHNLLLLNQCDWIIELGPQGGPKGGSLLFQGTPERLQKAKTPTSEIFENK